MAPKTGRAIGPGNVGNASGAGNGAPSCSWNNVGNVNGVNAAPVGFEEVGELKPAPAKLPVGTEMTSNVWPGLPTNPPSWMAFKSPLNVTTEPAPVTTIWSCSVPGVVAPISTLNVLPGLNVRLPLTVNR
jgi:hypothetical protein